MGSSNQLEFIRFDRAKTVCFLVTPSKKDDPVAPAPLCGEKVHGTGPVISLSDALMHHDMMCSCPALIGGVGGALNPRRSLHEDHEISMCLYVNVFIPILMTKCP